MNNKTDLAIKTGVALSGGADSLLALALGREQGMDIFAAHAYFLPPTREMHGHADTLSRICESLKVPFHVLDLHQEFEAGIINPFVQEYASGHTPNPCAQCNAQIKFGLLMEKTRELGGKRLATGHFARVTEHPEWGLTLSRGADKAKDQSYFLSLVPKESLKQAVFPLGERLKKDVAASLAKRKLTPPLPQESREICFVPQNDYRAFLEGRGISLSGEGPIVTSENVEVGRHKGLWRYTIGQRRGMGVAHKEPLYVIGKDPARNALIVGGRDELSARTCTVKQVNFLVPFEKWPNTVLAQTHYRQKPTPAKAEYSQGVLRFDFLEPGPLPAPGQVAAAYTKDNLVLAGGIIS